MPGEFSVRRLAQGLALGLCALGCSPTRETRQVTVVDRTERRVAVRPAPELARTTVSVSRGKDQVAIRVFRDNPCWVATRGETLLEVRTDTEPRTGWLIADVAITAVGIALLSGGRSEDPAMDVSGYGLVLTAVGVPSLLVDFSKFSSDTHQERRSGPLETELSRCSGPPQTHRVVLLLPDGRTLTADTRTGDVARFTLTEQLWLDFSDRIDCDVYVDGAPLRRLVLEREAP